MARTLLVLWGLVVAVWPGGGSPYAAAAPVSSGHDVMADFVRVREDRQHHPVALETSVTHMVLPEGQRVDLVAAIHLGERRYYQGLNQLFRGEEVVLYELLVGGSEAERPKGGVVIDRRDEDSSSALSRVQLKLCTLLGLQFQLYEINYAAHNFVHADLSLGELHNLMRKSGETPSSILLRLLRVVLEHGDEFEESDLDFTTVLGMLTRQPTPQEQKLLRRSFARSFTQVEAMLGELEGSALVKGRNLQALKTLQAQLHQGRRRLAIFYGAAHLPHLRRQLLALGAHTTGQAWHEAWDLRLPTPSGIKILP